MPTYTYQCKRCGANADVFHAMSANPRVKCPECGGPTRRLIGAGAALIFKGSGFYETDYKRSGSKDGDAATKKETAAKSDTKTEAKSESNTKARSGNGKASTKSDS